MPTSSKKYKIYSVNSNKPIAIAGAGIEDGGQVVQWTDTDADHFKWIFQPLGQGYFKIYSVKSNKPIAVAGASADNGAKIIQWTDTDADHFKWVVEPCLGEGQQNYFKIYSLKTGTPFAIEGAATADGAKAIQWTDTDANHFKWRLVEVS
jgi:ricin-type beta-trefoil lectin protein